MYHISDRRAAIREIQKYLHFASDRGITQAERLAIDGIFGDETKTAVKKFQTEKGLTPSGVVDNVTFDLLYLAFLEARALYLAEEYAIDSERFPFREGDVGNSVLLLNLMLDELGKHYLIYKVDLKPYYSRATENAAKDLRKIYRLKDNVGIDLELYNKMRHELLIRGAES